QARAPLRVLPLRLRVHSHRQNVCRRLQSRSPRHSSVGLLNGGRFCTSRLGSERLGEGAIKSAMNSLTSSVTPKSLRGLCCFLYSTMQRSGRSNGHACGFPPAGQPKERQVKRRGDRLIGNAAAIDVDTLGDPWVVGRNVLPTARGKL